MVRPMRRAPILAALVLPVVLLAACGDDNRTAGGVTEAEADALDEAAGIVEQQRLPAEALQPGEAPPAEQAASDLPGNGG